MNEGLPLTAASYFRPSPPDVPGNHQGDFNEDKGNDNERLARVFGKCLSANKITNEAIKEITRCEGDRPEKVLAWLRAIEGSFSDDWQALVQDFSRPSAVLYHK